MKNNKVYITFENHNNRRYRKSISVLKVFIDNVNLKKLSWI